MADLKEAVKTDDVEAIKAKTQTLAQASMKLGEAMYKAQQAQGGEEGAAPSEEGGDAPKPTTMWWMPNSRKSTTMRRRARPKRTWYQAIAVHQMDLSNEFRLLRNIDEGGCLSGSAMMKRCYYETLGCKKGASATEMKALSASWRWNCHPDRNPGRSHRRSPFKEINEAYDILKDDQKRAAYDRFGHAAFEGGSRGPGHGGGPFDFAGSFTEVFDDIFGEFMGGARRGAPAESRRRPALQSGDHRWKTRSRAATREIKVPSAVACETCGGSGADAGHESRAMPDLFGHRQGARAARASSPSSAPAPPAAAQAR